MISPGGIIDTSFLDKLTARLNALAGLENVPCDLIQEAIDEAGMYIAQQLQSLENQVSQLAIVKQLLSAPTDLDSAISWITNTITLVIGPYYQAYLKTVQQIAALAQAVTTLTSAISNLENSLTQCSLSFTPPSIVVPTP